MNYLFKSRKLSAVSLNLATSEWDLSYQDGGTESIRFWMLERGLTRIASDRIDWEAGNFFLEGVIVGKFDPAMYPTLPQKNA